MNMNQCKKGDLLISSHGTVFKYIGKDTSNICREMYPHEIMNNKTKARCTRTDDGFVFKFKRHPDDEDIIDFLRKSNSSK